MKVVILAGGLGTRLAEETLVKPKPMVEIGGIPMIEHIMNWYMKYNFNEFIICLGYKGHEIISYFKDYNLKNSNITISSNGRIETINSSSKPWKINLIQTGENTQTGGRIKKIANHLKDNEQFFMTYGDGLSNVDLNKLLEFHNNQKKLATITAVRPLARFGALEINKNKVSSFKEKPISESGWINGGFFVLSKKAIKYIDNFLEPFETGALPRLAAKKELSAFKHEGFWQPMDTLREKLLLNDLWETGKAPWQVNKRKIEKIIPFKKAKVS